MKIQYQQNLVVQDVEKPQIEESFIWCKIEETQFINDPKLNLGELVYLTQDAKLLETLLFQNNALFDEYLGEKNEHRETLTLRLLMLENYEIWEAFAQYSTVLEDSMIQKLLSMFNSFARQDKRKFDDSLNSGM